MWSVGEGGVRNFIIQISSDIDEPHERIQLLRLPCIFYLEKTWRFGRYYFRGFIDSAKGAKKQIAKGIIKWTDHKSDHKKNRSYAVKA